jgi:hypothetical protein
MNIAPDYFDFDLYINMISTLNTPGTNIHMVSRGFHVRENKILLDFLFYIKYNNLKVSGDNKIKF